jgi:autotransporter-associated beta strand protein
MIARYTCALFLVLQAEISISFAQTVHSLKDGNWDDTAVWSSHQIPDAGFDSVFVNHTILVRTSVYSALNPLIVDQLTVGAGSTKGYLMVDSGAVVQLSNGVGIDLTFEDSGKVEISGNLIATSGVTFSGNSFANFNFLQGSTYEHQATSVTSSLPTANFDAASTLLITGFTVGGALNSSWNIPLGNVVYNCSGQGTAGINFAGYLSHIRGNFDIQHTGTSGIVYFNDTGISSQASGSAISIGGHLSVSGTSRFFLTSSGTVEATVSRDLVFNPDVGSGTSQCTTTGSGSLTVLGNATMHSGTWNFSSGTNGNGVFNLLGNLASLGAVLTETGGGTSQGNLNFNGTTGQQLFDPSGMTSATLNVGIHNSSGVLLSHDLELSGTLSLANGNFVLPGTMLTLNGPIIQTAGSLATIGPATLFISGSGPLPSDLPFAGESAFNIFQVNRPGGTIVSSSNIIVKTLELYGGTFSNNGNVTILPAGLVDIKASASSAGSLTRALVSAGGYEVHYSNSVALSTGPELPIDRTILTGLTKSGSGVLTLTNDVTINGDLTISSGSFSDDGDSSRVIVLKGNFISNGNSSLSSSSFTFDHTGTGNSSLSGSVSPSFGTLNFSNNVDVSVGFRVDGNLSVDQGLHVTASTGTASFGGTTTLYNEGIVKLSSATVLSNGTLAFGHPLHVTGNLTVSSSGSFIASAGADLTLSGNLSVTGALTSNASITFADTTKITGTGSKVFKDIIITGSLTPNSAYTVTGNVTLSGNGTLNAGNSTTTFAGTTVLSNYGSGTILFNNITLAPGQSLTVLSDLTITGATQTWNTGNFFCPATIQFARQGTTTLRGTGSFVFKNVIIEPGTTFTPNAPYTITGNVIVNGVLRPGNSTVFFGGQTSITTTGSPTISFNNLTIADTLICYAGNIAVNGNFTNNGFFDANGGTITFAGSTVKNISGTSLTRFNHISISNGTATTDVSVESNSELAGILTLATNAHFDADGLSNTTTFTLLSSGDDPTIDASVAILPTGAQVQGNVTVQRYISLEGANHNRIYRYISASVSNASVSDLQNEIPVTGQFAGSSTCTGCSTNPSMYWYDETVTAGGVNGGYRSFPVVNNSEVLTPGRGYATFVRGNIDPVVTAGSAQYDLRGPINSGPINYNVTFTSSGVAGDDGWNLVGNPYPSAIDWNAASGWAKTNVGGSIYMLDNGLNPSRYTTWNGVVGTNGGSRTIAAGQGFFIQTMGANPVLTSGENIKTAGIPTIYFRAAGPSNLLRITLMKGYQRDEAVIHFRDSATNAFDFSCDALKLKNLQDGSTPFLNLSTLSPEGNQKLAINSLPTHSCATTVAVDVADLFAGSYEIDFSNMESFPPDATLLLKDNFVNPKAVVDIRQHANYIFQVTSDSGSLGSGRFEINVSYRQVPTQLSISKSDECQNNDVNLSVSPSLPGFLYFLKMNGNQIGESLTGGGSIAFSLPRDLLLPGNNRFEVWVQSVDCTTITFNQSDSIYIVPSYSAQVSPALSCRSGSVTLRASGAPADGHYIWYDVSHDSLSSTGQTGPTFVTPVLNKTRTYYVSIVNSKGCEGPRAAATATIINYDDAKITQLDAVTLQSNFENGNRWFFDKELLSDTTSTLRIQSSGQYRLEVDIGICMTTDEESFVITALPVEPDYSAYPNPVERIYSIELPADQYGTVFDLAVFDLRGSQIGTMVLKQNGALKSGQFDFSSYAPGVYFVRIVSANTVTTLKIVKK